LVEEGCGFRGSVFGLVVLRLFVMIGIVVIVGEDEGSRRGLKQRQLTRLYVPVRASSSFRVFHDMLRAKGERK